MNINKENQKRILGSVSDMFEGMIKTHLPDFVPSECDAEDGRLFDVMREMENLIKDKIEEIFNDVEIRERCVRGRKIRMERRIHNMKMVESE